MWWVRERGSALRMLRMLVWTSKCVWHPQYPQWWVRLSKASKGFGVFGQYFLSPCGSRIAVYLHGFQRLQTPNKLKVIRKVWALISQSSTVCRACTQPAPPHRMTQAVSKSQPRWSSHIWLSLKLAIGCAQTRPPDELSSKSVRPCVVLELSTTFRGPQKGWDCSFVPSWSTRGVPGWLKGNWLNLKKMTWKLQQKLSLPILQSPAGGTGSVACW